LLVLDVTGASAAGELVSPIPSPVEVENQAPKVEKELPDSPSLTNVIAATTPDSNNAKTDLINKPDEISRSMASSQEFKVEEVSVVLELETDKNHKISDPRAENADVISNQEIKSENEPPVIVKEENNENNYEKANGGIEITEVVVQADIPESLSPLTDDSNSPKLSNIVSPTMSIASQTPTDKLSVDVVVPPTVLDSLDLSVNRLEAIDMPTWSINLLHLDLSSNLIKSMEGILACKRLLRLNVSDNYIENFYGILGCVNLVELAVAGNRIKAFPSETVLKSLKYLDVSGNELNSLENLVSLYITRKSVYI